MADYTDEYFTNPDGLKQHYRDYNQAGDNAPVVLCMPGLTRNGRDFEAIAEHLSDRCRVICVEQRGRGQSDWDPNPSRYLPVTYVADMMALLAHLGVDKVIAIGTSLGGLMTIMIQAMHPGKLQAAVINDIGPEIDPKGIERIKSYVGKGTPPETWEAAVEAVKTANAGVYPAFTEEDWRWYTENLYEDVDGKLAVMYDPAISQNFNSEESQSSPDLWPFFKALHSIPMVVLRGGISDILSAETLERMAREHPDLVPVTVPGIGHVPLMREPECKQAIDELVGRFL
ncbi:alpha/beta fold hydrolase [Kordiimonas lacus]|uniref:Pimeloyl-ACP methyl ester carboxylesterase n=1 Tax=Kordiimonas lacus TaxID=637679 RepID=A0A1G7CLD2_9PROT|nr:alpha/beta hydrolase [Kordiimonas lacus]SDE40031.1 Pimeloyl-ACP methyl ester carboxylesterase [Kordiimonas lacus]